jgi:hypothetical protein
MTGNDDGYLGPGNEASGEPRHLVLEAALDAGRAEGGGRNLSGLPVSAAGQLSANNPNAKSTRRNPVKIHLYKVRPVCHPLPI